MNLNAATSNYPDIYRFFLGEDKSQKQPPVNNLSEQEISSSLEIPLETILLEGRHTHLSPRWYQVQKTSYLAGKFFLAGSAGIAGATTWTAIEFTALPLTVVMTVGGLAFLTVVTALASIILLRRQSFWQDPAFLFEQGKKAIEEIRQNHPSYAEIQSLYREHLRYEAFGMQDINILLREEAKTLSFVDFHAKHLTDTDFLTHLDGVNQHLLSQSLQKDLKDPLGRLAIPYQELLGLYRPALSVLDPQNHLESLIQSGLQVDIQELSYSQFKDKHFANAALNLSGLNEYNRFLLIEKFIQEKVSVGFKSLAQTSLAEIQELKLAMDMLEFHCLNHDLFELLHSKTLDYKTFRIRNNFDRLPDVLSQHPELITPLQQMFKNHLEAQQDGLLALQTTFAQDLNLIGLNPATYHTLLLKEIVRFTQSESPSYAEFKKRNGLSDLQNMEALSPGFTALLYQALCTDLAARQDGYLLLQSHYQEELGIFARFNFQDQLIQSTCQKELPKLVNGTLSYDVFRNRNGATIIDYAANTGSLPLLQARFLEIGYLKMKIYESDLTRLHLNLGNVIFDLEQQAINPQMDYAAFKTKHGLEGIRLIVSNLTVQQSLKQKFLRHVKNNPYEEVVNCQQEAELLGLNQEIILQERWFVKPLPDIFAHSNERKAFLSHLKSMDSPEWREKIYRETAALTVEKLLKNYSELFDLKIFMANGPQSPTIQQRFFQEASPLSFEGIIACYPLTIFSHGIFSTALPQAQSLIINYYLSHPEQALQPTSKEAKLIQLYHLNQFMIEELTAIRQKMNNLLSSKQSQLQHLESRQQSALDALTIEVSKQVQLKRQSPDLTFPQQQYQSALQKKELVNQEIAKLNESIENFQKRQASLQQSLDQKRQEIKKANQQLQALESQALNNNEQACEQLEKEIASLKSQAEQPVKGLMTAIQILKQNLSTQIQQKERQLDELRQKPKQIERAITQCLKTIEVNQAAIQDLEKSKQKLDLETSKDLSNKTKRENLTKEKCQYLDELDRLRNAKDEAHERFIAWQKAAEGQIATLKEISRTERETLLQGFEKTKQTLIKDFRFNLNSRKNLLGA